VEKKMTVDTNVDRLSEYATSVRSDYESALKTLVDIPSVSMDPAFKKDVLRAGEKACELLKQAGAKAEIIQTKGYPVIIGEFVSDPKHPTVTVYNHIDVQPADPDEWQSPPFHMSIENGVYRGRGTTDDKGPALAVLYAAKYAHEHKFPINIKFIWELEEENGSPSFEGFLKANKDKLKTDSVVVSDTIWVSREKPAIPYGLRGLQAVVVKLKTGAKDVHSGTTGGLARNPIGELCQVISECYDARTGHVNIPGFYDDVRKLTASESDNFVSSGFDINYFKKAHELHSLRTEDPRDGSQRIWAQPTFEVHGIVGGYSGTGVKTIIPHAAEAKISMRLVPNQDPEKILKLFTDFVKKKCPDCEVTGAGTLRPYSGEFEGPFAKAAAEAMVKAFGEQPAFTREGGSIGAVVSMNDVLKVPITFLGLSLPEHGYHAINENFDWQQAGGGITMFITYFELLSKLKG
jgi:acetylornithine deacetylase/succinyl-diaminopimelate desuccinylase-like protein